jgi:exonuclease SbcC
MRITRLTLQNFRVFAEVDLELPPGVVGVYGPNGSGKSTLVEAVLWALFGVARTGKEGVRRDGAEGECRVVVGFEHDGHDYEIVRSVSGASHTVKAEVSCDGIRLATGATAVRQYVHQVLGMSADAFRSSVFCEQKQLDAFSSRRPEERRRLVLDLLGITPIDRARDTVRSTSRALHERVETARLLLGDLDALGREISELEDHTAAAAARRAAATDALAGAEAALAAADAAAAEAERKKVERDRLAAAWNEAKRRTQETAERLAALEAELAGLDQAAQRLAQLEPAAGRLEAVRSRVALLTDLARAEDALARATAELAAVTGGPLPDLAALEAAATEAERASAAVTGRLAGLDVAVATARQRGENAHSEREALQGLDRDAPCPLCGQSLSGGDGCVPADGASGFDAVLAQRDRAVAEAEAALAAVEAERAAAHSELTEAKRRAEQLSAAHRDARRLVDRSAKLQAAQAAAAEECERARASLGRAPAAGELEALQAEQVTLAAQRDEALRLTERLGRRDALAGQAAAERRALDAATEETASLLAQGRAVGFDSAAHAAALAARGDARAALEAARAAAMEASLAERGLSERLAEKRLRLESELARRSDLAELESDARHHGRLAELLSEFRNSLVGEVGPALSAQTTELFRWLTDGRFDRLDVDGDTFELRVSVGGTEHSLERHSGSETDLANLSLRVAIAEQVSLLAGGQVGLLVLDEVVGSLDGEHRDRLVDAIGRLGARFRQVILVTHSAEIKEQLPNAVEVVPLGRNHAEARLAAPALDEVVTSPSPARTPSVAAAKYL